MMRSMSSSQAALEGVHTRMRGLVDATAWPSPPAASRLPTAYKTQGGGNEFSRSESCRAMQGWVACLMEQSSGTTEQHF